MKSKASTIASVIAVTSMAWSLNAISATAGNLPAMQRQGEVTYLSGGVGQSEANAIKHIAKLYPLELEFLAKAKPRDAYLSDINVQIKDAHDKMVLDTKANGPFLLAKIPAGKYTISVENGDKVEKRQVEIASSEHRRVVFEWRS